jgi:hypothetical protein
MTIWWRRERMHTVEQTPQHVDTAERARPRTIGSERSPRRAGAAVARTLRGRMIALAAAAATLTPALAAHGDARAAEAPVRSPAADVAPVAPSAGITLREDGARWESGYGEKFFQVVGTVTNGGSVPVSAVRVRTELLDGSGKVVAAFDGWNARAEALGDLGLDAARAELPNMRPDPIPPGESDRFRATFLADETPAFSAHRARVDGVLPPP